MARRGRIVRAGRSAELHYFGAPLADGRGSQKVKNSPHKGRRRLRLQRENLAWLVLAGAVCKSVCRRRRRRRQRQRCYAMRCRRNAQLSQAMGALCVCVGARARQDILGQPVIHVRVPCNYRTVRRPALKFD